MTETKGISFEPLRSLEEARQHPEGMIIFEGDYGGTIYLTAPAHKTLCDEATLNQLLTDIDVTYWNDAQGAKIYYEKKPVGSIVAGGMGGGKVLDKLWLHEKINKPDLEKQVNEILAGTRKKISLPNL